jgi:hypothetical protein
VISVSWTHIGPHSITMVLMSQIVDGRVHVNSAKMAAFVKRIDDSHARHQSD